MAYPFCWLWQTFKIQSQVVPYICFKRAVSERSSHLSLKNLLSF